MSIQFLFSWKLKNQIVNGEKNIKKKLNKKSPSSGHDYRKIENSSNESVAQRIFKIKTHRHIKRMKNLLYKKEQR